MNDVPDRGGFYEEDPYDRKWEREDPTDEERRESLVDCLLDIADPWRNGFTGTKVAFADELVPTADDLAAVTRDAEIDLQIAKAGVIAAQDYLIAALQAEIDFLEEDE